MSLQINNLSKSFSVRKLFSEVTFNVNPGECVALVGNNGCGKSTMMKIILGKEHADTGTITHAKDDSVGYLPQEIFLFENERKDIKLWELVTQAFSNLQSIKTKIENVEAKMANGEVTSSLQDEYERLQTEFEKKGGYTWQAKTIRLLKGFGFPENRFHEELRNFSGGWQMRAYFVRLLLSEPDYLLLDEPTNYLDIASISFLEDYLADYEGGILVVSHDRYFLDSLADSVVAIMPEGARQFRGNYSKFLEAREEWAEEAEAKALRQDKERKRIERFVERFRYKATKAAQVQSRIKMLEKMETIETARSTPKLHFSFPECEESGEVVMRGESITRSFGEHHVLKDVSFVIEKGDRLAIVGENGAGKTTLMRILAGEDNLWGGKFETGYRVHLGYFAQDEEISFEENESVLDRMMRDAPFDAVPEVRNILGAFLFSGDEVEKKVKMLSGGEKSRLGLARMMLRPCNLLLLDEPTNHLDITSREALLNALEDFPGTIIIVSHDRFFLDSLATKVLGIENGKSYIYKGNYSQYMWSKQNRDYENSDEVSQQSTEISTDNKKQQQIERIKLQKQFSNKLQKLKREIENSENKVAEAEAKVSEIERLLANPPDSWNAAQLTKASENHKIATKELEEAMTMWENLCKQSEETELELSKLKGQNG